jgi:tRNA(Ile)-lysidine synthetase-like protein
MDVDLPSNGKYVVAVSGGVDSIVLLDILQQSAGLNLYVAHFDHGMRINSKEDRLFVEKISNKYGLKFEYKEGNLGKNASEAVARNARYNFLEGVRILYGAKAIITAHHLNDVIETTILNMLRGTNRKGLSSLQSSSDIMRPLLKVPKSSLVLYAKRHNLPWREDPSNININYLRNYIRHKIIPRLSDDDKIKLLDIINSTKTINQEIDSSIREMLNQSIGGLVKRQWFNQLPHSVSREVMAAWLRQTGVRDFDRKTLERLVVAAKTASAGQTFPIRGGVNLEINKHKLALTGAER